MIACDEIINAADSVSRNVSIKQTVSINFHNKKVRDKMDCYILHTVLLVITLLFIFTITSYHYYKAQVKKMYWHTSNIKMKTNELNRVKNCMCYYFDDIITFEDFDFDHILIDEK